MKQALFKVLTFLSPIVLLASLALWCWGELGIQFFTVGTNYRRLYFGSEGDEVLVEYVAEPAGKVLPYEGSRYTEPVAFMMDVGGLSGRHHQFGGLRLSCGSFSTTYGMNRDRRSLKYFTVYGLSIPYYYFAAASGVLTGTMIYRQVRGPKRRFNECQSCGYDLRATPDRCPECGTLAKRHSFA